MAYPTNPVTFVEVAPGENRTDVATMLGSEMTAIETALLDPAAQTTAPIRMRQSGFQRNQIEWGPAAAGRLSVLGSTNGRSFIGLGCEAGPTAGKYTTRAQKGIVLTTDGAAGLLVQSVPLVGTADQTPVTRFTVPKSGFPLYGNIVLGSWNQAGLSVAGAGAYVNVTLTVSTDPYGFYSGDASGNFRIPTTLNGWYLWIASVSWGANAAGNRLARFVLPAAVVYPDWKLPDPDGGTFNHQCVLTRQFADAETFNFQVAQTSGATLTAIINVRMLRLF
jgi:hypothetical protein